MPRDIANLEITGYYIYIRCSCGQINAVPILDSSAYATITECSCKRRWRVKPTTCPDGQPGCIEMRIVDAYDNIIASEPARVEPAVFERLE